MSTRPYLGQKPSMNLRTVVSAIILAMFLWGFVWFSAVLIALIVEK